MQMSLGEKSTLTITPWVKLHTKEWKRVTDKLPRDYGYGDKYEHEQYLIDKDSVHGLPF